jgi:hypothetical protein
MKKRNWTVHVAGFAPFPIIVLDGEITHDQALTGARLIWPRCTVE